MNNIQHVARELFNKIRSRFDSVFTEDEKGKDTEDPEQARFFHFKYASSDGIEHGILTVNIADNKTLKLTFGRGLANSFEPQQEQEWEDFLRSLRQFARRNLLKFDIRDINRSNLSPRDIQQVARTQNAAGNLENPIHESIQWSGTTRTSIQDFGPTKLIVRHSDTVDPNKPGSRSRKIQSMFVETMQGERFRMPVNRLSLGRAMAQHLAHGGKIYDEAGQHIVGMAEELHNLAFFIRNTRQRTFEDSETQDMVVTAVDRYSGLRSDLNRMTTTRGYHQFAQDFKPNRAVEELYDIDALKERFVKKLFDDRLTSALPFVYRAYQQRLVGEQRYVREFTNWVDRLDRPSAQENLDLEELKRLMSKPIKAGSAGENAIAAISSVVDDDDLNDLIGQAAETQGPDTDIRQIVDDWLLDQYPNYMSLIPVSDSSSQSVSTTATKY